MQGLSGSSHTGGAQEQRVRKLCAVRLLVRLLLQCIQVCRELCQNNTSVTHLASSAPGPLVHHSAPTTPRATLATTPRPPSGKGIDTIDCELC